MFPRLTIVQIKILKRWNISPYGVNGFFTNGRVFDDETFNQNLRSAVGYSIACAVVRKEKKTQ